MADDHRVFIGPGELYIRQSIGGPPTWKPLGTMPGTLPWDHPDADPLADIRYAARSATETPYGVQYLVGPEDALLRAQVTFSGPGIDRLVCLVLGFSPPRRGGTWMYCTHHSDCPVRFRLRRGAFARYLRHWRHRHALDRAELEQHFREEMGL